VKLRRVWVPARDRAVWVEERPARCPGCARPYRGGRMAVGWLACGCPNASAAGHGHRTLFCRDCGTEVFLPPHLEPHGPTR
jgi:hypothetical protein